MIPFDGETLSCLAYFKKNILCLANAFFYNSEMVVILSSSSEISIISFREGKYREDK